MRVPLKWLPPLCGAVLIVAANQFAFPPDPSLGDAWDDEQQLRPLLDRLTEQHGIAGLLESAPEHPKIPQPTRAVVASGRDGRVSSGP